MSKRFDLIVIGILFSLNALAQAAPPFGRMMERVLEDELLTAPSNDGRAKDLLLSQQPDGSWKDIAYAKTTITAWEPAMHFQRLLSMASAYVHEKSALYGDESLKKGIVQGLRYWADNDFRSDNWWHNDIAMPKAIGLCLILLKFGGETVPQDLENRLVNKMVQGDPYVKTGANKSDIAVHYFYRALITKDEKLLKSALEQLFYPVQLVDGKEGLQYDLSYLQHGPQLYIAGYGEAFMNGVAKAMAYVRETPYAIDAERLDLFSAFVRETYLPLIRAGYIDFNVQGRGISRPDILRKKESIGLLGQMLLLDPKNRETWEMGMAKLEGSVRHDAHTERRHAHYWKGDYTVHLRKNYHFNVRMASNRTNKSESGNGENLYGKHLTDGVTNIQVFGPEYDNIFPVWEWDKIPGTTTRDAREDEILEAQWGAPAANAFAGGVSASGYGLSAMKVDYDGVTANKAWFFFDEAVVCLGSGITSRSDDPITTTVNQTWLSGAVLRNGTSIRVADAMAFRVAKNEQIAHNHVVYSFPEPADVRLTTGEQKGSWQRINRSRPKAEQKGKVFKLWLDHGFRPASAKYAYIVHPGVERQGEISETDIQILENSDTIQAVRHRGQDLLQIVFYEAGTFKNGDTAIRVNAPILLQLHGKEGSQELSVADPHQSLADVRVQLSVGGLERDLTIELPQNQFKGKTATVTCGFETDTLRQRDSDAPCVPKY